MKINTFKRIIKEEFKEDQREMIDKIAYAVNPFAEEVIKALSNNLTVADNLAQKFRDVTVEVDATGTPKQPLLFKTNLTTNCLGILTMKAVNLTNPTTYPTGYPFLSFTELNNILTINNITGLPANNKFTLRLLLY
jgi:hypothetical protein